MIQNNSPLQITPQEARRILWRQGKITDFILDNNQKFIRDSIKSRPKGTHVIVVSRQTGKTYGVTGFAIEELINRKNITICYVAPRLKQAKRIIKDTMDQILRDCPDEMKPRFDRDSSSYIFPSTNSKLELYGFNAEEIESARGPRAHMIIVDECGFMNDLKYGIRSVLRPKLNSTKGPMILISTLPKSQGHEYYDFIKKAEFDGTLVKRDIYQCPRYTKEDIDVFADEVGGYDSVDFKREYLNIMITDENYAVIPEANEELFAEIVKEWKRPPYYDCYVSMDIGVKDLTFVLFGYYDFIEAKLIIEDEISFKGKSFTTSIIANNIERIEHNLWKYKKPFLRVCDNNNLILVNDLNVDFGITFIPTAKDNKHAWINQLRIMLADERIIINPKCKQLLFHLKNATWNKNKTDYERSLDGGHYDGCFIAGTKIITSKGVKNIEDVKQGDLVLTHKGRFKPVLNTMVREYEGDLIKVKPVGREPIVCTPNHEFYVGEFKKEISKELTGQQILKEMKWERAKDLTDKNKVHIPYIEALKNINITNELCFLYGYYVAEGSLGGNGTQIQFAGHKRETKVMGILEKAVIDSYTNPAGTSKRSLRRHKNGEFSPRKIKARIYDTGGNGRVVTISCKQLYQELKKLNKSVYKKFPDFIHSLNQEQALYMLAGYLFGDGHFSKSGIKSNTISENIKNGIDILSRIIGVTPRVHQAIREDRWKSTVNAKNQYVSNYTKQDSIKLLSMILDKNDLSHIFKDKNTKDISLQLKRHYPSNLVDFQKETITDTKVFVYNFEVEEDNSYTVNGVSVHNCDALAYMLRNVALTKNPYPAGYGIPFGDNYITVDGNPKRTQFQQSLINMFTPKKG